MRPVEHEESLHTPHMVTFFEIEEAKQALSEWQDREVVLPVGCSDWLAVVAVIATIEGWIAVATEHGTTRRSLRRAIERTASINGIHWEAAA